MPKQQTDAKSVWSEGKGPHTGYYWKSLQDGKWRFNIVAKNGLIVAASGGQYERIRNLRHTLDQFKPVLRAIFQLPPK